MTYLESVFLLLLVLTGINYSILIIVFTIGWKRIKLYDFKKTDRCNTTVSIIISIRNEEDNIVNCLEHIVKQDYPAKLFEIIVVNDFSTDTSLEKIRKFQTENRTIKIIIFELAGQNSATGSKKAAITAGVAIASGELIITTDADCIMRPQWMKQLVSYYEEYRPSMIIAPVCFISEGSFFSCIQQLEFLSLQAIAIAVTGIKKAVLANGANLAYTKEVFNKVNGYSTNSNIASGDDIFLMQQVHKSLPGSVHAVKSYEALIYTQAPKNLKSFLMQRKRWVSKMKYNKDIFSSYTALSVFLFNLMLLTAMLVSIFNSTVFLMMLFFLFLKAASDFPLLWGITQLTFRKKLLYYMPVMIIIYPLYIVISVLNGIFGSYNWKGRRFKY